MDEESELEGGRSVKVSALAKMSGVPAATIKHYVREGLLPEPSRTSKNMAYYDVSLVPRIKKIKELQRTRFLPLKVIKSILDESELESEDETVGATIARVLEQTAPTERRTREELIASGMPEEQLVWLRGAGLITPQPDSKREVYAGDDLELLRVLGASRKAGITAEMLPVTILGEYAQALRTLVEIEVRMFREGVMPRAGDDLPALTEAATTLSERLVIVLRRRMLVPTMRALAEQAKRSRSAPPPAPKKRTPRRKAE
ncbi:MerR family transcriptional regulator [Sandaracinus amylolyticus]|uniref:MerR family transcriptional regulator n=1 Tax=Sandaracinus amylolyticus TaxID=927083 RepID=UPI00069FAC8D|nr:MerR family transcriptional regulator [Sandaracinus amylolyticus]